MNVSAKEVRTVSVNQKFIKVDLNILVIILEYSSSITHITLTNNLTWNKILRINYLNGRFAVNAAMI